MSKETSRVVAKVGTHSLSHHEAYKTIGSWASGAVGRSVIVSSGATLAGENFTHLDDRRRYYAGWRNVVLPKWHGGVGPDRQVSDHLVNVSNQEEEVERIKYELENRATAKILRTEFAKRYVPVVNEDYESGFGDNDKLAAHLGVALGASMLVIVGEMRAIQENPDDPKSRIPKIGLKEIDDIRNGCLGPGSENGTGGPGAKLDAAEWALSNGVSEVRIGHWSQIGNLANGAVGVVGTRLVKD